MDVTEKTFHRADPSTQNWLLFDSIQEMNKKLDGIDVRCEKKHTDVDEKISKAGKLNKGIAAGTGIFGGWLAVITSKVFGM